MNLNKFTSQFAAFAGVSSRGALYFDATAPSSINTWDGPSEVHRSHQIAKSSFITQLEKEESGRIDEDQDQDQQCQVENGCNTIQYSTI